MPATRLAWGVSTHQVKMVAHQAIGMHLEAGLLAGLRQGLEKILPVHVIQKNVLTPVAAAHHMVNGARILNSQFSRHGSHSTDAPPTSRENEPNYGLTPALDPCSRPAMASPGMKLLLLAHVVAVPAFQSAEDDRGQDGESAQDEERLVDAVNHFRRRWNESGRE